jgi:hypothetical protein
VHDSTLSEREDFSMSKPDRRDPDPGASVPAEAAPQEPAEEQIDEAVEETFPASDPPAWEPLHTGPPVEREDEEA